MPGGAAPTLHSLRWGSCVKYDSCIILTIITWTFSIHQNPCIVMYSSSSNSKSITVTIKWTWNYLNEKMTRLHDLPSPPLCRKDEIITYWFSRLHSTGLSCTCVIVVILILNCSSYLEVQIVAPCFKSRVFLEFRLLQETLGDHWRGTDPNSNARPLRVSSHDSPLMKELSIEGIAPHGYLINIPAPDKQGRL